MTVRLLRPFNGFPTNAIVDLDRGTEAALVSQNAATFDLDGGTPFRFNSPLDSDPLPLPPILFAPSPAGAGRTVIYDAARDGLTGVTVVSSSCTVSLATFDGEPALQIAGNAGVTAVVNFSFTGTPYAFDRGLCLEIASNRDLSTGMVFQASPDNTYAAFIEAAFNPSAPSTSSPWGYRTIQPYMTTAFAGVTPADPNFTPGYQGTWTGTPPTFPTELGAVRFRISPNGGNAPFGFVRRFSALRPRRSRIVFTFDDGLSSAYRLLKPIMDRYNFKGTFDVIANLVDSANPIYLRLREVAQLYNEGHEIVAHGPIQGTGNIVTNYPTVQAAIDDAQFQRDTIRNWGYLTPQAERVYIWPQGQYAASLNDARYLNAMRQVGFTVGRTASTVVSNCIADIWPETLTLPIIGHTQAASAPAEATNISNIVATINGCASRGTDGILMFHNGVPSTDTAWGSNGGLNIRTTDFDTICAAVAANVAAGTQEVVLMSRLLPQTPTVANPG